MSRIKSVMMTISTKSFQQYPNSVKVLYSSGQTKIFHFSQPLDLPNTIIEFINSETIKGHFKAVNVLVDSTNCTMKYRVSVLIGGGVHE